MVKILVLLLSTAMLFITTGCSSRVPITTINSVQTRTCSDDGMKNAIYYALKERNWIIVSEKKGEINAKYERGDVFAQVSVKYTNSQYSINYVNSNGLNSDGAKINKKYLQWTRNLDKDIATNISYSSKCK